jgi:hypothetical protein
MEKFPTPNVSTGFWSVENDTAVPLPGVIFRKLQFHAVGEFADVSVNVTDRGAVPDSGAPVKDATGGVSVTVIYPVFVSMSLPPAFVAVRVTAYVPVARYACDGFCEDEPPPSPKSHDQEAGEFVDRSVNWTVRGLGPESGLPEKSATGTGS